MATTDNNMLMLVLIALGLIGFAASGSPGADEEVDRMGVVEDMAVDQYIPYSPHGNSKEADLGDLNARGRQIIEYITQQAGIIIGFQRRFDQGMSGGKDVTWLQENAPDELAILRSYIVISKERASEFQALWEELRSMTGGGNEWMRNNSDLVGLPGQVADRLQRYYNVSPDSIMKYQAQLQEQMGRERMQLNQVLQEKLSQFQSQSIRDAQGQVEYFMNFAQQQAARNHEQAGQIQRIENQLSQMEVDAETGSALLQDPFSHQTIVHNTVNKFQYNDFSGNTMSHQVNEQSNLPQSMASRNVPENPYYNDPNTGQGWAIEGGSARDSYGISRPQQAITYGPTEDDVQEAYERHVGGVAYAATNENGRRAITNEEARGTYDTEEMADFGAGFTPNSRTAQANSMSRGQSTVSRINRSPRKQQNRVQAQPGRGHH